jgi:hypothetical protein
MRYLRCDFDSDLNGSEDGYFEAESHLVADDRAIASDEY